MNPFGMFTAEAIGYLSSLFVFVVDLGTLLVVVVFIRDVTQTKDAIRRNFPVIGRFRYFFTKLGESSASTSLLRTARNCRSTEPSVIGSAGLRPALTTRQRSAQHAISPPWAR